MNRPALRGCEVDRSVAQRADEKEAFTSGRAWWSAVKRGVRHLRETARRGRRHHMHAVQAVATPRGSFTFSLQPISASATADGHSTLIDIENKLDIRHSALGTRLFWQTITAIL